ncbi:MAG: histone deacetylase family protein [Rhodovibrionaceae bacterium]|nr:histone deacetylase family protein [Rhodovibrionaceae bacterium]
MKIVFSEKHDIHYPRHFLVNGALEDNPEVPERAGALLDAARADGHDIVAPEDYGRGPIADVHTAEYLDFLSRIYMRWQRIEGASEEVIPNIHPNGRAGGYPASAVGQAGYHMADTACPIGDGTWEAACESANVAVHAAIQVLNGADAAYALCRPPGHHAFADMAGGFCYLNNSAIAAQYLRRSVNRVAILDVDLHHGNGTQGIFYERPDVLTVSLHADPVRFYPFFWGYAEERGTGPGLGFNLNVPLVRGTGDDDYVKAMAPALRRIVAFAPDTLVVALGLDAHESDPLAGLAITTPGFAAIGREIGGLGMPTVLVQEGGYMNEALGANLQSFLSGFLDNRGRTG